MDDILFFNEVRNDCAEWLHDTSYYTVEESMFWFSSNEDPFFIYEKDGEKVAYFRTSNWKGSSCYIGMDIHKDFRGKKLAVLAYESFMKMLNYQYNISVFKLEVLSKNIRAYSLYKKLGFKEISRYNHNKDISIVMEKKHD